MTLDTRRRVKCPNGHWATVETVLAADLATRLIRSGQSCPTCKAAITDKEPTK